MRTRVVVLDVLPSSNLSVGILEDFYLARWQIFVEDLDGRLHGKPGRDIDYFVFEKQWTEEQNDFPVGPSGDPTHTALTALAMATGLPD